MRLRLPLSLASLLIAALSYTASAATYTWTGATNSLIHTGNNWSPDVGGAWSATWSGGGNATNTILINEESTGSKTLECQFSTMALGGLTVSSGATGFTLRSNNNGVRPFNLNGADGADFLFDINEDFSFGANAQQWTDVNVNTNVVFQIASGKAMEFYGSLNGGAGKSITLNSGGSLNIRRTATTLASNWVITDNSTVNIYKWSNNSEVIQFLGSGSIQLDEGSSIIFRGSGQDGHDNASGIFTMRTAITGKGTVELYYSTVVNENHRTVDFGDDFEGIVNLKTGRLSLTSQNGGPFVANYGKGTLLLDGGTYLFIKNVNGGNASTTGGDFGGNIGIGSGAVLFNFHGDTNTVMSGKFTGQADSEIVLKDSPRLITYTGDWSQYGGKYNNESGRTVFDTNSVVYLDSLVVDGNGLSFKSGTLVLGSGGISGGGNFKVGTVGWSSVGIPDAAGDITISSTNDMTWSKAFEVASGSKITFHTQKYDPASGSFTEEGTTITLTVLPEVDTLVKSGTGQLKLNAADPTFSGNLIVEAGTLSIGAENALGTGSTVTFKNGTTLTYSEGKTCNNTNVVLDSGNVIFSMAIHTAFGPATTISGDGGITKVGVGRFDIRNASGLTFLGDVNINGGVLYWGAGTNTGNVSGDSFKMGEGVINIASGAQFSLHLHTNAGVYKRVENQVNLVEGGRIFIEDGSYILAKLDVQTTSGEATIQSRYAKNVKIESLTGAGNLVLLGRTNDGDGNNALFIFQGDNSFTGSVELRGTTANKKQQIELLGDNALKNATVSLNSVSGGDLYLIITADNAQIAGLNGTGDKNSITSNKAGSKLTVTGGGSFNGSIGADVTLIKKGTETLTLTGTSAAFNKSLISQAGILDVSGATIANANYVLDGGVIRGITLVAGQTLSSTGAAGSSATSLTLDGGIVDFSADESPSAISVGGTLTFGSNPTVFKFNPDLDLNTREYNLFTLETALADSYLSGLNLLTSLYTVEGLPFENSRFSETLSVTSDKMTVKYVIAGSPADLVWNTDGDGEWKLAESGTEYWSGSGAGGLDNYFYNLDKVTFGDVLPSGTDHVITIEGTVKPGSIVVNADSQKYVFEAGTSGVIAGDAKLVKSGAGTLEINLANTYTGGTDMSDGVLTAGAAGALGSGKVTLSGGTLGFVAGALGSVSGISTSAGTIKWEGTNTDDIAGKLTVADNSELTFDTGANNVSFGSALSATGVTYTKTGTGVLTLGVVNSLKGTLKIDGGQVTLVGDGGSGRVNGAIIINNGGTLYTNSDSFGYNLGETRVSSVTINQGGVWTQGTGGNTNNNQTMANVSLVLNGGEINGAGRIDFFRGDSSLTAGNSAVSTISVATVAIRQPNTNVTVGAGSTLLISSNIIRTNDTGTANLIKLGDGKLVLSGANGFDNGTVTVEAGTLELDHNASLGANNNKANLKNGSTLSLLNGVTLNSQSLLLDSGTITLLVESGSATLDSNMIVSGNGSLKKTGAGHLIINGAKTFVGGIDLAGGRVSISDAAGLGAGTNAILVSDSTVLDTTVALSRDFDVAAGKLLTLNGRSSTGNWAGSPLVISSDFNLNGTGSLALGNVQVTVESGESLAGSQLMLSRGTVLNIDGTVTFDTTITGKTGVAIGSEDANVNKENIVNVRDGGVFNVANTVIRVSTWNDRGTLKIAEGGTVNAKGVDLEGWGGKLVVEGGVLSLGTSGLRVQNDSRSDLSQIGSIQFDSGKIVFTENSGYVLGGTSAQHDATGYFTLGADTSKERIIEVAAGKTASIDGVINGNGGFTKAGTGTLKLTKNNTYTGNTLIKEGILDVTGSASPVANYVLDGGALHGARLIAGQTLSSTGAAGSVADELVLAGGKLLFNAATGTFGGFKVVDIQGGLTFEGDKAVFKFVSDSPIQSNDYDLVTMGTALSSSYTDPDGILLDTYYTFEGISTTGTRYEAVLKAVDSGTKIILSVTGQAGVVTWNTAGDGIWDLTQTGETKYWKETSGALKGDYFFNGDRVVLGDVDGGEDSHTLTISGALSPAAVVFEATDQSYELVSADSSDLDHKLTGGMKLEVKGQATLTVSLANDFTGGTEISSGTLATTVAGALGSGPVAMTGGVLEFADGSLDSVQNISVATGTLKWATGASQDILGKLALNAGAKVTFDTNGNNVALTSALNTAGVDYVKTGAGDLALAATGALRGSLVINEGSVSLGSSSTGEGIFYGSITVEKDAKLITGKDSLGYDGGATSVSAITLNESTWQADSSGNSGFSSLLLTMNKSVVEGTARLDFEEANSTASKVVVIAGTENEIKNDASLRQSETEFNIAADSSLSLSGRLGHSIWEEAGVANFSHVLKTGAGTLILTGDNNFSAEGDFISGGYQGETRVNEGTLQIGNGGASGTLGQGGKAIVASGAYLAFNRNDAVTVGNVLDGAGTFNFDSGEYTLSGVNTLTGVMNVNAGKVLLGNANALGAGTVNVLSGGTLDYNGLVGAGSVTVNAENGATLARMNSDSHVLNVSGTVTGTGGLKTAIVNINAGSALNLTGDLESQTLNLKDKDARITASGDITVTSGGSFRLGLENVYSETNTAALVQGGGDVSLEGTFSLKIDTNIGAPQPSVYYLFGTGSSGTYTGIKAEIVLGDGSEYLKEFFELDTSEFQTTGKVSIGRLDWVATLVNQADVTAMGSSYTPSEPNAYLGARQEVRTGDTATQTDPVIFDLDYNVADNAYKLTNGLGWMDYQSQMTGDDNRLVVVGHFADGGTPSVADDEHGIIISNNTNDFGGGTRVLDAHVVLETGAGLVAGEANTLLGTGTVELGGNKAILELRPGGAGDTSTHEMANDIELRDGATLLQTSGTNQLTGSLSILGSGAAIANTTAVALEISGALSADNGSLLTLKGADSSYPTDGLIILDGATGSMDGVLLTEKAHLVLNGQADVSFGTLTLDEGSDLYITDGSRVLLLATEKGAGTESARVVLAGGTLALSGTHSFNGSGDLVLNILDPGISPFSTLPYNTIEVVSGVTTIDSLAAGDGSFTKTGAGLLILTGDLSSYTATAGVGEGAMEVETGVFGGSLSAGGYGDVATLKVADGTVVMGDVLTGAGGVAVLGTQNSVVVEGNLLATGDSTVTLSNGSTVNGVVSSMGGASVTAGNNVVLDGGFTVDNATLTVGNNSTIGGSTLNIGNNGHVVLGRNTVISASPTDFEIGSGSSIRFGRGSSITGIVANGIVFNEGSSYGGFVDAVRNNVTFKSGSMFVLNQTDIDLYSGNITAGLLGGGTISIEEGTIFQVENGLDLTNAPLAPDNKLQLIMVDRGGSLLVGGQQVVDRQDYSDYLGETDYAWFSFTLLGGKNSLNLEIVKNVKFDDLAGTANEQTLAPIANSLAANTATLDGELKDMGTALALSTTGNAGDNLSQMALSYSGVMAGHVAQMENLRRHGFETLNRAVQEKTAAERLNYETTTSSFWVNGLGGSYKLDGDDNAVGSTTNVWGGTIGASTDIGEHMVAGMAFTYSNLDTRLDRSMGKTEADSYSVDLFARYNKDNWNVAAVLTGGVSSMDIERDLNIAGYGHRATSSADGSQLLGMVQVGYEFVVSRDMNSKVEPFVLVSGGYSSIDGFSESGAGNAGLTVESQSQALCTAGAGVRFVRDYMADEDESVRGRFEMRAMVLQDLKEVEAKVDGYIQGLPQDRLHLQGTNPDRTAFIIGAGVVHPLSRSLSVFADVDGEFRGNATGVGGVIGVKYSF